MALEPLKRRLLHENVEARRSSPQRRVVHEDDKTRPGEKVGVRATAIIDLEDFALVTALEATRAVRVNVVSPGWVKETMVKFGMDITPGKAAVDVARADVEAVEGSMNGETLEPK